MPPEPSQPTILKPNPPSGPGTVELSAAESLSDRVIALLAEWQLLHRDGRDLSPAELCPDDPDAQAALTPLLDRERRLRSDDDSPPELPGYAVGVELGRGGMGRVHDGRDLTLDRPVAIKTLIPGANADRFETEAKITARLPHPGIPPVHALGRLPDGRPYMVMKKIDGRTLADLLNARPSPADDLSRFVQIFERIAEAVGFAHANGVVHRDLKPANVMTGAFGEVQVMDWGLAKVLADGDSREPAPPGEPAPDDNSPLTRTGSILGSPGYMAPEQARGEAVDARADVFALRSLLTEVLTGRPAIVGSDWLDVINRTAAADLADAFARLDGCGADAALVALA